MISLILAFAVLVAGFFGYGWVVNKVFSPDDRKTPAYVFNDGVDCVPMSTWKVFLIQLLNIAGTGPIFGALMGAVFGPVVFLWIVFGAILAGAVHDYMSGMISSRHEGQSIAVLSGIYLNKWAQIGMSIFAVVLLVLCGTVFVTSPAQLLAMLTPAALNFKFWMVIILLYYFLATILPIDKLIGKLYPLFGIILIIMAVGVVLGICFGKYSIPEITLHNLHPKNLPAWPFMFVTVACGAISGFHATQSPMMAKCIKSEREGRKVFYGAMIAESMIALAWAAAGVTFYGTTEVLNQQLGANGASGVVYNISTGLMGMAGGVLAIVGVAICPITSGDTAFRSARLIIAEWFHFEQKSLKNRLIVTLPLLLIGAVLTQIDFNVLWRYFSWSNQTLAMFSLIVATVYLRKKAKHAWYSMLTAVPAAFMSAVSVTYILMAKEGFQLSSCIAYPIGAAVAVILFVIFLVQALKEQQAEGKNA